MILKKEVMHSKFQHNKIIITFNLISLDETFPIKSKIN